MVCTVTLPAGQIVRFGAEAADAQVASKASPVSHQVIDFYLALIDHPAHQLAQYIFGLFRVCEAILIAPTTNHRGEWRISAWLIRRKNHADRCTQYRIEHDVWVKI